MREKRGLFQKIFGRPQEKSETYQTYKLLSSYQTTFTPFSGNAYDVNTVCSSVDSFARRVAVVKPRHIRRGEGKLSNVSKSKYNRILQFQPNPYYTAYKFYYRLATQYKIYNNAFVYPVWNELTGELEALYNVNANTVELLEYEGEMWCRLTFANGHRYTCPYTDLIHIGTHFCDNDIFGDSNSPIIPVLQTANTFNQSMSMFAKLVAVIRGVLKIQASVKNEDLNARREEFVRDNLQMENNGAGIVVTDNKTEYIPTQSKETPLPTGQLQYVKDEIHEYFGTNVDIVQNKETPEQASAFYNGEIKPFFEQCSQAFTNALFSGKEMGFGNEIIFEGNSLQNEKLSDKTTAVKFLCEIGAVTLDQVLDFYNLPPIGGEEGTRRIQTLNVVNAALADKYQLGESGEPKPTKSKEQEE